MSTIAENLNTLYDIKDGIKAAIEGKGVDVGETPFVEYAQKINDIQQNADCEEAYNSGYNQGQTEGYKMGYRVGNTEGFTAGKTLGQDMQKAKLTTLTVTENGVYESEDGYSKVTVDVHNEIVSLTQDEYDALEEINNNTIYLIKG